MYHICACNSHACICQAAFKGSYRECFDCWDGYHWYSQKKKSKYKPPED